MCIREIKEDLLSEAELLIYQMKAAQLTKNYEAVSDRALSLTNICKKLDFIREEEERFIQESDF